MRPLIARQPIFDADEKVYAYEMVASESLETILRDMDGGSGGAELVGKTQGPGHGSRKVFLEMTAEQLGAEWLGSLPAARVVLQVSHAAEMTPELMAGCQAVRESGFTLALGDFILEDGFSQLAPLVDILRIDFEQASQSHQRMAPIWSQTRKAQALAYNVPSKAAFTLAKNIGYSYFHGPFAYQAEFVDKTDVPGFKLNYLRLLQEINSPDMEFDKLEEVIKQDVSLTFKLLKYINSAAFGLRSEIESIHQALTLMGTREVRKWSTLVTMTSMGEDLPEEALVTCVLRGRFLETLGVQMGQEERKDDLFFMGIFSMIELFMGRPKEEILSDLPLRPDIRSALLGEEGTFNTLLNMVLAYEDGDWDPLHNHMRALGLPGDEIPDLYFDALDWTEKIFME